MLQVARPGLRATVGRGTRRPGSAAVSPLYADLAGLPPVHTFQGGRDILAADAQLLADRLRQAGNPGTFTFVPGAFHNYVGGLLDPGGPRRCAALRAVEPAPLREKSGDQPGC